MFGHRVRKDDAWEGVVTKKRRVSPNGQYIYYRLVLMLTDGTQKKIRVRRALWRAVNVGDRLVKLPGNKAPAKAGP